MGEYQSNKHSVKNVIKNEIIRNNRHLLTNNKPFRWPNGTKKVLLKLKTCKTQIHVFYEKQI